MMQPKNRDIERVKSISQKTEWNGFLVGKVVGGDDLEYLDPILMFDHIGPIEYAPGEAIGAPDHPHRGMLILNYLLEGSIQHEDTLGNEGVLRPGSVQLLSCGRGLVHFEMPSAELVEHGGVMEGFQIWLNVPLAEKMLESSYQEVQPGDLPMVRAEDNSSLIRVLSGEVSGVEGGLNTTSSLLLLDVALEARAGPLLIEVPENFNCLLAYVWRGQVSFDGKEAKGDQLVGRQEAVIFRPEGSQVTVSNAGSERVRLLLLGARQLGEPHVRHGPFAMATEAEVVQATADYQAGRMGHLAGAESRLSANEEALRRHRSRHANCDRT